MRRDIVHAATNRRVTVIPASMGLLDQGTECYRFRTDKSRSLTDCIPFVVMKANRPYDALSADHHFEQAGFILLQPLR